MVPCIPKAPCIHCVIPKAPCIHCGSCGGAGRAWTLGTNHRWTLHDAPHHNRKACVDGLRCTCTCTCTCACTCTCTCTCHARVHMYMFVGRTDRRNETRTKLVTPPRWQVTTNPWQRRARLRDARPSSFQSDAIARRASLLARHTYTRRTLHCRTPHIPPACPCIAPMIKAESDAGTPNDTHAMT